MSNPPSPHSLRSNPPRTNPLRTDPPIHALKDTVKTTAKKIYEVHYKKLLLLSFLLVILALVQLGVQYTVVTPGSFVQKGISLQGGSAITITLPINPGELEIYLRERFPERDLSVRQLGSPAKQLGVVIESDTQTDEEIQAVLQAVREKLSLQKLVQKVSLERENYSVEIVGAALGNSFFHQMIFALILTFIMISVVVFFYLRSAIPSLTVILAAISDLVITLAVFNLLGLKLSSAGVAAFLMLIGYSVDTDLLLSVRVLRRHDLPLMERIYSSITTGMTMTLTTLAAVLTALFLVQSDVVRQIMIILCIGLFADTIMTWIQNVGILRLYLEKKERRRSS